MIRIKVKSSNIHSIGYDPQQKLLEVAFNHGGIYHFKDVPGAMYRTLMHAPSKGRFFADMIRDDYEWERIDDDRGRTEPDLDDRSSRAGNHQPSSSDSEVL